MSNQVADRLKANAENIMRLWENRAQEEIEEALHLKKLALRDHLPEYLSQIVDALSKTIVRTVRRIADDKRDSTRVGHEHGHERATFSHYSIDQVIYEFHLLREVIFEVMEKENPLSSRDRDIIISSIEQAVNDSATQFAVVLREIQQKMMVTLTHDLRTPITSAKLSAEFILKKTNDDIILKSANRVVNNMDRVDEMIDDLLDSSRVRAGQSLEMEFHQMDLTKLLDEICDELKGVFGDRIVLKQTGPVIGNWSESGLRRLIENLITNAVKYGSPDTDITVSVANSNNDTVLKVHNEGSPIADKDIPTLFDQFQRGPNVSAKKGWGIGLTLVKGVAEAHKGKIDVESSHGNGTTFSVTFPNN